MSQSEDIFLYEEVPGSSRLVIMFSAVNAKRFTGYKTLQNAPVNRLFVKDPTQSWYNRPVHGWWDDADGLLERLRTIAQRFDPANIVCMGGYAAILFGCKLNVRKVAAFSPQIILDSRLPNNPSSAHKIQYRDMCSVISHAHNTAIDIVFGSEEICDVYEINKARQYGSIEFLNVYGAEHNVLHWFLVHGVLSKIMVGYAVTGRRPDIKLPLCFLHEDSNVMQWVKNSVEAYYFNSPQAAISSLETLVQQAPQWSAAHCWLGMARARANDTAGAVDALYHAISRVTLNSRAFLELAAVLSKLKKYQEAESAVLRSMQMVEAPSAAHYYRLGITYLQQNKLSNAKEAQNNAVRLNPKFGDAHYQLGLIANKEERFDDAVAHFEKMLSLSVKHGNTLRHLSAALKKLGRIDEATAVLREFIENSSHRDAVDYYNLGILYFLQKKFDDARVTQENALSINSKMGQAHYQLGIIKIELQEYAEAIQHFETAMTLGDRNRNLKKHLVTALFHSTTPDKFDYAHAAKLCPDHPLLKRHTPKKNSE